MKINVNNNGSDRPACVYHARVVKLVQPQDLSLFFPITVPL